MDGSIRALPNTPNFEVTKENIAQLDEVENTEDYADFEELLALIESGEDINEELEDPAAGNEGGVGDEIGQGLQFFLNGGEVIPIAGIDPNLVSDPISDVVIETDPLIRDAIGGRGGSTSLVNDAPIANDDFFSTLEDTSITYSAAQILGNDTDINGDPLTIVSVTSVSGGSVVLNPDGTVTFTPDSNFSGTAEFSYIASDGSLESNEATVTVTVTPVAPPRRVFRRVHHWCPWRGLPVL